MTAVSGGVTNARKFRQRACAFLPLKPFQCFPLMTLDGRGGTNSVIAVVFSP